ncbi:hypothetical protein Tco_0597494 [Tanacetum coccineum]
MMTMRWRWCWCDDDGDVDGAVGEADEVMRMMIWWLAEKSVVAGRRRKWREERKMRWGLGALMSMGRAFETRLRET